ncbi:hypothetical protein GTZ89_31225 [Streptomyces sp. SID8382]|nr:hypothetical protein [Streptomyces sp. SID8382]
MRRTRSTPERAQGDVLRAVQSQGADREVAPGRHSAGCAVSPPPRTWSGRGRRPARGVEPTYRIVARKVDIGTAAEAEALVSDPADAEGKVPAVAYVLNPPGRSEPAWVC